MGPIRVILADDHAIVLTGLRRLFESEPEFTVVECCRDGREALAAVRRNAADVLVVDQRMPDVSGLGVLQALQRDPAPCRVVLLTAAVAEEEIVDAVRLGACGIVLKESSPESLLECVRQVYRGERWFDVEITPHAFERVARRESVAREAAAILTPREMEIVGMIAQGLRNRTIADRLGISEGTVKIHLHNIYDKAGVSGRLELALWARSRGIIGPA